MKSRFLPFFSLFLLLIAFVAPTTSARANSADQKIRLVAFSEFKGAKGTAKFRDRKREQEFQVEVELSRRFAGTVFTVVVDDAVVGRVTINKFGQGRLSLNSRQGDAVPAIENGSLVGITTTDGAVALAGQF